MKMPRRSPQFGYGSAALCGSSNGRAPSVLMLMRQFHPIRGGYENQSLRLAEELRRRQIDVSVLTQRHRVLAPYEEYRGIGIHRLSVGKAGHVAALQYLAGAFLWAARRRHRFDLIHAQRSTSGLVAGLIGFVLRKPVLYKLTRGDEIDKKGFRDTPLGRLKARCLTAVVDRFVAITAGMERDLKELGVPADRIVRIPNGIELPPAEDDGARTRARLGFADDAPVVTFVGRLIPEKGIDWLLAAWKTVAAASPAARLLIVGDGPEGPSLRQQARALGVAGSVRFLGHQESVPPFLRITDVFVLPSRMEGVSNALLEAMSQGIPTVVGDDVLGGNREIVTDGKDGFVVPLGDGRTLSETILRLLGDRALRAEIGRRARTTVGRNFSIESVADRYCALYEELLSGSNPAAAETAVSS